MEAWTLESAHDLALPETERWRSLRRECGALDSLLHALWWSFVRGYLRLFHRLEIRGRRHLPVQPPFLLVANHASHLDALVLFAALRCGMRDRVFPLASGDAFFGGAASAVFSAFLVNALPIWKRRCRPLDLLEL